MQRYGLSRNNISHRDYISKSYGGVDEDIRRIFFQLDADELGRFFHTYEAVYGRSKRQYAERVYNKWRSGEIRMSGALSERLLQFLPPLLSPQTKYELIEKLWTRLQGRQTIRVRVRPDTGYVKALELVRATVDQKMRTSIPSGVRERLGWLCSEDAHAAEKLVKQVLVHRTDVIRQQAGAQIRGLFHRFERERGLKLSASKEIVIGGTTIIITMKQTPFYRRIFGHGTKQW